MHAIWSELTWDVDGEQATDASATIRVGMSLSIVHMPRTVIECATLISYLPISDYLPDSEMMLVPLDNSFDLNSHTRQRPTSIQARVSDNLFRKPADLPGYVGQLHAFQEVASFGRLE
jgi:hypothetical protein